MRAALPLLTVLSAGCLFVGEVNGKPSVEVAVAGGSFSIGSPIELFVRVKDDQSGATASLRVTESGGKAVDCMRQSPTDDGWELVFWDAGIYEVEVLPVDRYGAVGSSAANTLVVLDHAPTLGSTLTEGVAAVACGANWSASQPIPIVLAAPAVNPDAELELPRPTSCTPKVETTTYTWTLSSQPTGGGTLGLPVTGPHGGKTCPTAPSSPMGTETIAVPSASDTSKPAVCLYPDPSVSASVASTYGVRLDVTTSAGSAPELSIEVPVLGDAPACFDGSYPAAGSYVVPSDEATVFEVVGADDVSPTSELVYTWTLTRADGTSAVVQPATDGSDGGARFSLDPTVLGASVGETVRLRADVVEPGGASACVDSDDRCLVASCVAAGSTCPSRISWSLEFR